MKVYVAGPMRGIEQFNFPAFFEAQAILEFHGHEVFNPAARDTEQYGPTMFNKTEGSQDELDAEGFNLREALHADTEFITMHADALCVLPGWSTSKGATAEVALAKALGLPVIDLADWQPMFPKAADPVEAEQDRNDRDMARFGYAVTSEESGEVRSVSSTGGEKGTKLARYDLIPAEPLKMLAEHYGRGARKYEDRNWERGYEWSKSFAALMRHAWQFWSGEDMDEETGSPHMIAVAWHALALAEFMDAHEEFDDRP